METATTISGNDILAARKALGYTRPDLADALGMTVSQVARCEIKGPKETEAPKFLELLRKAKVVPAGEAPEGSWHGLQEGMLVKVAGGPHDGELVKYVDFNPETTEWRARNLHNGGMHNFRADQVRNALGHEFEQ